MKLNTEKIENRLLEIAKDGSGIVADDKGNGCAGPGFIDPDAILEMIEDGTLEDAIVVDTDHELAQECYEIVMGTPNVDELTQIEFNFLDTGYHQIAWVHVDR